MTPEEQFNAMTRMGMIMDEIADEEAGPDDGFGSVEAKTVLFFWRQGPRTRGEDTRLFVFEDDDEDDWRTDEPDLVLWSPDNHQVWWDEHPLLLKRGVTDIRVAYAEAQKQLESDDITVWDEVPGVSHPAAPVAHKVTVNDDGTWTVTEETV
jgi:hypothetical protein